jgi:hypothetical protein
MPSLTRTMLLSAGRASTRAWLRSADVDSPSLRRAAESAYRSHTGRVPWPGTRVLQAHLVFSVLPGAAMYTALQAQGASSAQAARLVEDALIAMAQPRRRVYARLVGTDLGRRVFMRAVEMVSPRLYPGPGWQATWRERSPQRVAFDFTRCYIVDMLRRLDATALAPAYCTPDDALYADLHPQLRWARSGTLATGAPVCDFCFELRPPTPAHCRPRTSSTS